MSYRRLADLHRALQDPTYDPSSNRGRDYDSDEGTLTSPSFTDPHERMIDSDEPRGRVIIPNVHDRIQQIKRVRAQEAEQRAMCPNYQYTGFQYGQQANPDISCFPRTDRPTPFPYLKRPQPPPFPLPMFDNPLSSEDIPQSSNSRTKRKNRFLQALEDEERFPGSPTTSRNTYDRNIGSSRMPEIADDHRQAASLASPYENPSSPFSRNAYELDARELNGHPSPFSYQREEPSTSKAMTPRHGKKIPFPKRNQTIYVNRGVPTIQPHSPGTHNTFVEVEAISPERPYIADMGGFRDEEISFNLAGPVLMVTGKRGVSSSRREVNEAIVFRSDVDFNQVIIYRDDRGLIAVEEMSDSTIRL